MITQEELKTVVNYDPDSGDFTWLLKNSIRVKVGGIAGSVVENKKSKKSYRYITISYGRYRAHRLAWLYMTGEFPKGEIDHINHNGVDNRWCNLRDVTKLENLKNMSAYSNNTSGVAGIYWHKLREKWMAGIKLNGKSKCLGYFDSFFDAVCVRKSAEKIYGFHKNHCSAEIGLSGK